MKNERNNNCLTAAGDMGKGGIVGTKTRQVLSRDDPGR